MNLMLLIFWLDAILLKHIEAEIRWLHHCRRGFKCECHCISIQIPLNPEKNGEGTFNPVHTGFIFVFCIGRICACI